MNVEEIDPSAALTWLDATALVEGSERYASMFTHHPHAAYSVDRCGHFTDANRRALEMTGLDLEQMRESHFSAVIHPEDRHLFEAAFVRALAGEPQVLEGRVLRADSVVIDVRCTAIPVVVGGEVVGVHGITEDTTESKRVLRELEEANAAKTLFLATVSHEVRTPLAVLVGAVDLLMDAELDSEPAHYAHLVQRASQRLMIIVDDVLEFSGLDAQATVLRVGPFEPRFLVGSVAEWAVPAAESRGLSISFVVGDDVPVTALGDGRRIAQVLTNLVQNAIAFTETGGVEVEVGARADGWVELTVRDTGIGIAEEHLQALFEPFAQADPSVAREHRGVGLGLAICRELVDMMGGRLRVRSTLGEGSTFTLGLPLDVPTTGERADDGVSAR